MWIILKKILGSFLVPPGLFLLLFFIAFIFKKKRNFILVLTAILIYTTSLNPVANLLLLGLEKNITYPSNESGEAIVVLGGGGKRYFTGFESSLPAEDFTYRLYAAFRLYLRKKRPIIISGGKFTEKEVSDAEAGKAFLVSLGVSPQDIIKEEFSRDTHENAIMVQKLIISRKFKEVTLVTSAYHIKRASQEFSRLPLKIIFWPSHFLSSDPTEYSFKDFLPQVSYLRKSSLALHEYFGLLMNFLRR